MKYWFCLLHPHERLGFVEERDIVADLVEMDGGPYGKRSGHHKNSKDGEHGFCFIGAADSYHLVDPLSVWLPTRRVVELSLWELTMLDEILTPAQNAASILAPEQEWILVDVCVEGEYDSDAKEKKLVEDADDRRGEEELGLPLANDARKPQAGEGRGQLELSF